MSQPPAMSRKRPAPLTPPLPTAVPIMPPYTTVDSTAQAQVPQEQYIPWNTTIPSTMTATTASAAPMNAQPSNMVAPTNLQPYDIGSYAPTSTSTSSMSTQLTRRPIAQVVPRSQVNGTHGYVGGSTLGDTDHLNDQGEGLHETDAAVEQRALLARKEALDKRRQIPPFVQKLMSFLNDEKNTPYIRWSDDGNSFIVVDEDEFARTLIPEMFKHNKYPSFVRQLNMYGFHKKVRLSDNSMRAHERKNKSPSEYANPYFKRGRPDLLWLIQKPKGSQSSKTAKTAEGSLRSEDREDIDNEDVGDDASQENRARFRGQLALGSGDNSLIKEQLANVYSELQTIRQQQQIISSTINKIRREHDQLYNQAATFQEQHTRHENSINAILTFLATVYNRSLQGGAEGVQSLMNSFQNAVPQEHLQGPSNVLDMNMFNLTDVGSATPGQRNKKVPLLLKAAPDRISTALRQGTTASPPPSATNRPLSQRHPSVGSYDNTRNIEELVDTASPSSRGFDPQRSTSAPLATPLATQSSAPQRDIMSAMRKTNTHDTSADHEVSPAEFSDMIAPLKGNNAASVVNDQSTTTTQPGEMLRMIADQASSNASQIDSLTTTNMGVGYPGTSTSIPNSTYTNGLASSRADIEKLIKMQAEQDRNVQNLTNLLQPLSPTGAIPGLNDAFHATQGTQPPFDLENIFSGDYFANYPTFDASTSASAPATAPANDAVGAIEGVPAINDDGTQANHDTVDVDDLFNFDAMSTPRMQNNFPAAAASTGPSSAPVQSPTSDGSDKSKK
ncbi:stress-responsive transcription factor hsf1 [Ascosphaera aggregata]|nr:stress-responsive transcription factor hsf1 [Ascosphaera aggregata]